MKYIANFIKNALFPKYCFGCRRLGSYVCSGCYSKLPIVTRDICLYCRRASWFGITHPSCKRQHGLDGVKSIYRYSPLLQKIIKNIKYHGTFAAVVDFLSAIPGSKQEELQFYSTISNNPILIPVPLHPSRFKLRGFNQSYLITQFFAKGLRFQVRDDIVVRQKNTPPQAMLAKPQARYTNMIGAFAVNMPNDIDKQNTSFIVVDDVWTTGSTIKAICRALKQAGASQVFSLTAAH